MIPFVFNLILAAVPALILLFYFTWKDRQKPEPLGLIWKTFAFGFLAVLPAIAIEYVLSFLGMTFTGRIELLFRAFIMTGLVEESLKLGVVLLFIYRKKVFDEVMDGIVYTVAAGLGFAFFENLFYTFGPVYAVLFRGITAVPLHALASGMMCYFIGMSQQSGNNRFIIFGLVIAAFSHGLYNYLLFLGGTYVFAVIPLLLIFWIVIQNLMKRALE